MILSTRAAAIATRHALRALSGRPTPAIPWGDAYQLAHEVAAEVWAVMHEENEAMRKSEGKLSRDGLPIDARDWTEADWQDLYEAVEAVKRRVAERRKGKGDPPVIKDWFPQVLE